MRLPGQSTQTNIDSTAFIIMKLPEKIIVRQILGYLRAIGAYCGKVKTMGVKRGKTFCFDPFLLRGMPDILCFHKSVLYFIECKTPQNKQTPEQEIFQKQCQAAGIDYILAHSLEEVQAEIK